MHGIPPPQEDYLQSKIKNKITTLNNRRLLIVLKKKIKLNNNIE